MKAASVIGEIFDIQTLNKIQPLRVGINQEKLIKLLTDLQYKDLIEVMNMTEFNTYYRFSHPFLRECLYQRMTFK
jgi:adenylate cyclase 10